MVSDQLSASREVTTDAGVRHRWLPTSLLFFLGWVFMYADRTILSPVQAELQLEFGLTHGQVGLLSSAFFLVYALMQIPSGILGDRYGRIRLIFIGFAIFAAATGLTGLVGSFGVLILVRSMAGLGEGFYYGPQYAKSSEVTPPRFRTVGIAIINSGQAFGITLGLVASGYLTFTLDLGWRTTFAIFAIPTFLVGVAILLLIPDKARTSGGRTAGDEMRNVRDLLADRRLLVVFLMLFCSMYGFFVMVTWLPNYLTATWGVERAAAGNLTSLVAWTSVPASLLVGWASDRFQMRRPIVLLLVPVAVVSMVVLVTAQSFTVVVVALVMYGLFGKLTLDPVLVASVADVVPDRLRSTAFGLYNAIGMSAAILAPYVTGAIVDVTGAFTGAFLLSIVLLAFGWLLIFHNRETRKIITVLPTTES